MAVVDEIAIKLGIQTSDLKAALADADASVKKFKRSGGGGEKSGLEETVDGAKRALKGLKEIIAAGGVAAAVEAFFSMAIARARESKDVMDENVQAVRRFGDAVDDTKGFFQDLSVKALGFLNRAGEGWGLLINSIMRGKDAVVAEERALRDSQASLDEFNQRMEERKKHTSEIAAAHRDLAKAQEEERQIIAKTAGAQAELNLASTNYAKLLAQISDFKGQEWERDKLLVEVQKAKNDLIQAEANRRKELKDAAEKMAEIDAKNYQAALDGARNAADAARQQETVAARIRDIKKESAQLENTIADGIERHLDVTKEIKRVEELRGQLRDIESQRLEDNVRIAQLLLKGREKLTAVEAEELKLLEGKTTKLAQQKEIQALLTKGVENLTVEERARLEVLVGQTQEIKEQKTTVDSMIDAWTNYKQTFGRIGAEKPITKLTDAELNEQILNQKANIARTQLGGGDEFTKKFWISAQQAQLQSLQDEFNTRFAFRSKANSVGAEAALSGVSAFDQDRFQFYLTQQVDLAKDNNLTQNAILANLQKLNGQKAVAKAGS